MAHKSNHANVKLKIVAEKPIIGHAIINVGSSRKRVISEKNALKGRRRTMVNTMMNLI